MIKHNQIITIISSVPQSFDKIWCIAKILREKISLRFSHSLTQYDATQRSSKFKCNSLCSNSKLNFPAHNFIKRKIFGSTLWEINSCAWEKLNEFCKIKIAQNNATCNDGCKSDSLVNANSDSFAVRKKKHKNLKQKKTVFFIWIHMDLCLTNPFFYKFNCDWYKKCDGNKNVFLVFFLTLPNSIENIHTNYAQLNILHSTWSFPNINGICLTWE